MTNRKYIKICEGFAIDQKTAWIKNVGEQPQVEKTEGFFFLKVVIKETAKFYFEFGDEKQELKTTCDTKEEALKEWERVLNLINGIENDK